MYNQVRPAKHTMFISNSILTREKNISTRTLAVLLILLTIFKLDM